MNEPGEYNGYGEELEQRLRLKTFPFAVKLLKDEREIPAAAVRPKRDLGCHLALCQGFALSRREGKTVAMLLEDMWCYSPVLAFGIAPPPPYYLEGNTYYRSHVRSMDTAANLAASFPRLDTGSCIGVLSAPLKKADFTPDMTVIYGDSAQLRSLLAALKYNHGELVTSTMEPASACVQAIVPVLQKGTCQVAVPCGGDRRWALAQDDEMIFTVPTEKLADLLSGLRHIDREGSVFPVKFGTKTEYPLSESYFKVSEMIGMEVHK
ncbi:MAG: DUF169 domain-containing protein [Thermodesulfobacteriota bacterium]